MTKTDKRSAVAPCRHCGEEIRGAGPRARHERKCRAGELATERMNLVMSERTRDRLDRLTERLDEPAWKIIAVAVDALTIAEAERRLRRRSS
jgi:hypothetical protein